MLKLILQILIKEMLNYSLKFYAVLKVRFRKQMHRVRLNVANYLINGNDVKTFYTDFD